MTDLDSICKSRDITLPTKVLLVKAMLFPGIKKQEIVTDFIFLDCIITADNECNEIKRYLLLGEKL